MKAIAPREQGQQRGDPGGHGHDRPRHERLYGHDRSARRIPPNVHIESVAVAALCGKGRQRVGQAPVPTY
ncbi:hypothetical protein GCM10010442_46540 [Kitasatospora kifunensis]